MDDLTFEFYHEALAADADQASWEAFTVSEAKLGEYFRNANGDFLFPRLPDLREAYLRAKAIRSGRALNAAPPRRLTDEEVEQRYQENRERFARAVAPMREQLRAHGIDIDRAVGTVPPAATNTKTGTEEAK